MAQPQKKSFGSESPQDTRGPQSAQDTLVNTPLAFWSDMAEMQRRCLSSLMRAAEQKAEPNGNVMDLRPKGASAAIGQNWMAAAAEVQREVANFMSDRLSKNQAFLASALAVPGMQELVQLQTGWMTQTAEDYTNELGKLSNIVKNGADEALAVTA